MSFFPSSLSLSLSLSFSLSLSLSLPYNTNLFFLHVQPQCSDEGKVRAPGKARLKQREGIAILTDACRWKTIIMQIWGTRNNQGVVFIIYRFGFLLCVYHKARLWGECHSSCYPRRLIVCTLELYHLFQPLLKQFHYNQGGRDREAAKRMIANLVSAREKEKKRNLLFSLSLLSYAYVYFSPL